MSSRPCRCQDKPSSGLTHVGILCSEERPELGPLAGIAVLPHKLDHECARGGKRYSEGLSKEGRRIETHRRSHRALTQGKPSQSSRSLARSRTSANVGSPPTQSKHAPSGEPLIERELVGSVGSSPGPSGMVTRRARARRRAQVDERGTRLEPATRETPSRISARSPLAADDVGGLD